MLPRQHRAGARPTGRSKARWQPIVKSHSIGEYRVSDHAGPMRSPGGRGANYPKLQCSAPFTPATGPRLMVRPGPGEDARRRALAAGGRALLARRLRPVLGVQCHLRCPRRRSGHFRREEVLRAHSDQAGCHSQNRGLLAATRISRYAGFAQAQAVVKNRSARAALENDITIEWLTGSDLSEDDLGHFFTRFYIGHSAGASDGRPYSDSGPFSG